MGAKWANMLVARFERPPTASKVAHDASKRPEYDKPDQGDLAARQDDGANSAQHRVGDQQSSEKDGDDREQ